MPNFKFSINFQFFKSSLNKVLIAVGTIAVILIIVFWFWWRGGKQINIDNDQAEKGGISFPKSSISGISCGNYKQRPIAVMISSDPETRPLSGIGEADIVFEMPVTPSGVTRMMAVFQCNNPAEVGSVRSAREDFIPLAAGFNAIYAHWGGEKEALAQLNNHIIDSIDAMKYEGTYFYRRPGVKQPHNGFTDIGMLLKASDDLKYVKDNSFSGYPHSDKQPVSNLLNLADNFLVNYSSPFKVQWIYNKNENTYKRFRDSKPEIDKNTQNQVEASVVAVIKTTSKFSNKDYLTVDTTGEGGAYIYQNGVKISGQWKKDPSSIGSKLFFYTTETQNGIEKEIEFTPGKIWVEIITD